MTDISPKNGVIIIVTILVIYILYKKFNKGIKFRADSWCPKVCKKHYPQNKDLRHICSDTCTNSLRKLYPVSKCQKIFCNGRYKSKELKACYKGCHN